MSSTQQETSADKGLSQSAQNPRADLRTVHDDDEPIQPALEDKTTSRKIVRTAEPVATKPPSAYAMAIEQPTTMVKKEGDSCLTCIKNSRKCKGTQLQMVKGQKRCQNCASPGKGSSGRICYWVNAARGVATFDDAVRIMSKELGGRILTKNTRKGRLERQERSSGGQSDSDVVQDNNRTEFEQTETLNEQQVDEDIILKSDDECVYPGLRSSSISSDNNIVRAVQDVVVGDLGVPEGTSYEIVEELAIKKILGDALGS